MANAGAAAATRFANGFGAFVPQLRRLTIHYCSIGGSSRHIRDYIQRDLPSFASNNPAIEFVVQERRGHHPFLKGAYLNGNEKVIGIKNQDKAKINARIALLRGTTGAPITRLRGNRFGEPIHPKDQWTQFDSALPQGWEVAQK